MTNNTPDYNDNLYFEKKMDCKNCPYTDEYCASGDCERDNDLTEKWKKGKLPSGEYYIKINGVEDRACYFTGFGFAEAEAEDIEQVLAPVPSYDEWKEKLRALDAAYKAIKMEDETINRLVCSGKQCNYEKAKLKELLKECRPYIALYTENNKHIGFTPETANLLQQIDEVLK